MMKNNTNKCTIITGGASGIGRSITQVLASEGYEIVIADINKEDGIKTAKEVGGLFVQADLTNRQSCRSLIDKTIDRYGRVDILVNNAGFQHVSPLEDFSEDKWDQMIALMLTAPFLLTKYVWPYMKAQQWGRVVNIASVHGLVASPYKVAYTSAKHGLLGLTRTGALEGGEHGITVNALCPGYVRTPLVEEQIADQAKSHGISEDKVVETVMFKSTVIKRMIEPGEIAELVRYLCSEHASSVTGASWTIDGGWTAQ